MATDKLSAKLRKINDQIKKEEPTQCMTTEHRIKKAMVRLSMEGAIDVRHGSNFSTKLWTSAPNLNFGTKFD